jgi:ribonuclease VapC
VIVDTSALIAILYEEDHAEILSNAISTGPSILPAPVVVEFFRVAERRALAWRQGARELLGSLIGNGATIISFDEADARFAADANARYGQGMGQGGKLNLLDLMVYAAAKRRGEALLCTGRDFAQTDVEIHPASRLD